MLEKLIAVIDEQATKEGPSETYLDDVTLFRVSEYKERVPLIYDQCLCITVQGKKICHLTESKLAYGPEHLLVVPAVIPVEVEVVPAGQRSQLGITIRLDFQMIQELLESINKYDAHALDTNMTSPGMYLEPINDGILEPTLRLLNVLESKTEAEIFGRQIIREILYRLLVGQNGHILASAAQGKSRYALISKALRAIHDNYSKAIDVAQLADAANMSTRAFHNHFKAVTSHSPVQYVKRIRLEKARQFIVNQGEQASTAAHLVGYESPSQFSREFKRYFGYPPREAARNNEYMGI